MPIEITAEDVTEAEEFLATVVAEQVTNGRYTDGTALRDLCIKALAVVSAQHRRDNLETQSLQSLLRIRSISAAQNPDTDPAVADATDAILSNWFAARKGGNFSRGPLTVVVKLRQDYFIPRTTRIPYDRTLSFYPDSDTDIVITAADCTPLLNANGVAAAYTFSIPVVAAKAGVAYDVYPANWQGTGNFSPYVLRVSNTVQFTGGKDREAPSDAIVRAGGAIAVRNLINPRSIDATLTERYPQLTRMTSLGMGDPEMQRDDILELATGTRIHVGGHFDVYMELPTTNTTFDGVLGGVYARPDGIANVFVDTAVTDWTATPVKPGDVIRITSGFPGVPRDFPIREVRTTELYVSTAHAFPSPTFTATYFIYRPLFGADTQMYPAFGASTTGRTFATTQTPNQLVLPPMPHYDILDVAVLNPASGDPYINAVDGLVHFTSRSNVTPVLPSNPLDELPFQVIGNSPANAQSARAFDSIVLPAAYNGYRVRVSYQTLASFSIVDAFVRDRYCANSQPKGFHPIYLNFTIPFRTSPLATALVDVYKLRQRVTNYVNSFSTKDVLDMSDVMTFAKNSDPNIGTVFPFEISYDLLCPDGRVISFITADIVAMDPAKLDPASPVVTPTELLELTISDRTVRYMTRLDRVFVEER